MHTEPDRTSLVMAVRALLGRRVKVTLNAHGYGTWSAGGTSGTWTDDGDVFQDNA